MPRMYPATVRRQIVSRLRSGEAVAAVAAETGICQATLFRWKRQALIDVGVIEGTPSVEADELAAAHKRIAQLEVELALTRDACELFDPEAVVRLSWRGVPAVNLPAPVRYFTAEEGGVSHFNYWRDNVLLTSMYFRLLPGFLVRLPLLIARRLV